MRRSSWQDGVLGTNCPIPPNWNWTYRFQVKDQIGSYPYVPSTNFQRAAGGFGGFVISNGKVIQIPFNMPDGDIVITIGDWYTKNHSVSISSYIKYISMINWYFLGKNNHESEDIIYTSLYRFDCGC